MISCATFQTQQISTPQNSMTKETRLNGEEALHVGQIQLLPGVIHGKKLLRKSRDILGVIMLLGALKAREAQKC
jgi:hypothetical protein